MTYKISIVYNVVFVKNNIDIKINTHQTIEQ